MRRDLLTRWGRSLDPEQVLREYPRPQLVRDSYLNLNGWWDYAITAGDLPPTEFDGRILVPFSPEAPLSGVGRQLQPHERLTYRRSLRVPDGFVPPGGRLLLHLGAVDQTCTIRLNGRPVGAHEGGYLPVTCDLTDALLEGDNVLLVEVEDRSDRHQHATGKQRLNRGGIWYTAQSGIWQTVWLEAVPPVWVERLVLVPLLHERSVEVTVHAGGPAAETAVVRLAGVETVVPVGVPSRVPVADVRPWSPEDPHLYDVEVRLGDDLVTSYVGMRSFAVERDVTGTPRLLLNGASYLHVGVLDQGYWPDGLMTPPSDEALVHDVRTAKDLGFTMVRKHVKVESARWYHHCDRLGLLVWQDLVNGGGRYRTAAVTWPGRWPIRLSDTVRRGRLGRDDPTGRARFLRELAETVEHLRNVPSLAVWVVFNEGWGQFDAAHVARRLGDLDPTRILDHASGWHDQGAGDLLSRHRYGRRFRLPRRRRGDRRAVALSEYGGRQLRVAGHVLDDEVAFGYDEQVDVAGLAAEFAAEHEHLATLVPRGLAATVYTQLYDVEDELNGLLTYDREVHKLDRDLTRASLACLRRAAGT